MLQAATASLLGRLVAQPLHGPRVQLLLGRLLPAGLAAAIRDGPGAPQFEFGFDSSLIPSLR